MKKFVKLSLAAAAVCAFGAFVFATPNTAQAGGFGLSLNFGHGHCHDRYRPRVYRPSYGCDYGRYRSYRRYDHCRPAPRPRCGYGYGGYRGY